MLLKARMSGPKNKIKAKLAISSFKKSKFSNGKKAKF
jgi:hypothetical protein